MPLSGLLVFAAVYSLAVASPGPGIAALVSRVLTRGPRDIIPYIAGFVVGDLIWFTMAVTGLAVLAQVFATLFLVLRYAGAAYLLYLAWKLWTAPPRPVDAVAGVVDGRERRGREFLVALTLTLSNPKAILFFLALLPTIIDLRALTLLGFAEITVLIAVLLTAVLTAYTLVAARARHLLTSPRSVRIVNRGTSVTLAGAAVVVATR